MASVGAADPRMPPPQSPFAFFALVFALSAPFLVLGALGGPHILPGVPLSGLAFLCPAVAAVILRHREGGAASVRALLARSFDGHRVPAKVWYLPVLLLYPAVVTASFFLLRLTGTAVPDPRIPLAPTLLLALGFFLGALCEELGWSGYATRPLRERWGTAGAGLVLGAVWAVWHWVPLLQVQRSVSWIAWWSLGTVAARVIMVWLFDHMGRSVLAMTLFHMTLNVAWQLFPVNGSHFDMPLVATLMAAIAAVIVSVGASTPPRRGSVR
ncbi:type II CAAX prenyl endopeptidase Rce1 family protein [Planomonospora sp. ID82291]|uniref:CPBP family glutamic-type intramembrane protease n=1 Tax=Planomonospora sp. ID82291 TaxID=2738136 RepID=UPI0018C4243F|nr:CPBP family glutamic-type intramembrane protease [Planomonospora sp. ID82291]MBG0817553.1 CPBP family intramembrane metalloprotease [Planomonospora sp. ID82291]